MTISEERATVFASLSPATGAVVGEHPVCDEEAVRAAVERARPAGVWWAGLGWRERERRLLAWKSAVVRRLEELGELVRAETGKPFDEAMLESILGVEHLNWAARNARRVLRARRVRTGLATVNQAASVEYQPLGVVGVIGPWNYPVFTPCGSIGYALAAGNAVVFKPSEYTPGVGALLVRAFAEVVPEHPVLQVVTGFGATGAALCRAGVDKIAFTGSTATAKRVLAQCADTLTPVVAECGGKDALIVAADADVRAAASAAVWGAMVNGGQSCVGVERVYAVREVYQEFLGQVAELCRGLRVGDGAEAHYGPITMPGQIDVIAGHIEDALRRGGRAVVGGAESVRAPYVDPVVLTGVPEDSTAMTEETFGPVLVVNEVRDVDEAVRRANGSRYGLGSAVFSGDRAASMRIARRLRTGATSVNSVVSFAAVPALPFGGTADSGFGRVHGADGLREFSRAKSITRQRFAIPLNLTSFQRTPRDMRVALRMVRFLHGR
ncbi:MAG TPA: aldehyde dehydrogenase family protein [Pseudonocardiaceae bacterium]